VICLINFSILPPNQSQEAPTRQRAALPHTAAPHIPVSPPPLTPAAGTKYHRPHPQQSAGHHPLSRTCLHHINRQDIQVFLLVATRPGQVERINNWISGICKDNPGVILLGAMHPEHLDPEAELLWIRQPGIKGIKLHCHEPRTLLRFVIGIGMMLGFKIIIIFLSTIPFSKISLSEPLPTHKIFGMPPILFNDSYHFYIY